ncbi:MAG: hypothetical protein H0W55_06735 [Actinobacteria bacterium]|nr:hypothetical protein [Actinomycetota bacterium]MDQ3531931.1 hypothetical protein [Actinomycetota bacterium]
MPLVWLIERGGDRTIAGRAGRRQPAELTGVRDPADLTGGRDPAGCEVTGSLPAPAATELPGAARRGAQPVVRRAAPEGPKERPV